MSKSLLLVVGVLLLISGVVSLTSLWALLTQTTWFAWGEVLIGLLSIFVAASDKRK